MSISNKLRIIAVVICLVSIVLAEWIMWEAVVKPLKNCCPGSWNIEFPSPFYIFWASIWLWHDLSIFIVIICSIILVYLALGGGDKDDDM